MNKKQKFKTDHNDFKETSSQEFNTRHSMEKCENLQELKTFTNTFNVIARFFRANCKRNEHFSSLLQEQPAAAPFAAVDAGYFKL